MDRLCRRVVDHLRRDCLIRFALDIRGCCGNRPLRSIWDLAKSGEDRRLIADGIGHTLNSILELVGMFVENEAMRGHPDVVIEPFGELPHKVSGDEWLWRALEPLLFEVERGNGELDAGEQLFNLIVAEAPVLSRSSDSPDD